MAANSISTLSTKQLRQVAKLDLAQLKRKGYTLYADGTTNFGSAQFSGSNYLSVTNAAFTFTGNFTVEGWYYPTNVTGSHSLFCLGPDPANRYVFALSGTSVSSNLYGFGLTTYTSTVPINTWTHIAVVRSGSTVKVYINGIASVTTDTQAGTIGNGTLNIGADAANGALFLGNISNFRVVKGTALYTGTFTPSRSPFGAITGTQLLLNTDDGINFLKDSSTNNFTVTNTGSVVTSSLGPGPDTVANFYRANNTYDITLLPDTYVTAADDNANTGGLVKGRPWLPNYQSAGLQVFLQTAPITGATWTDTSGNGNNATIITTGNGTYAYTSSLGGGITLAGDNGAALNLAGYNLATAGGTYSVEVVASISSTNYWSTLFGNDDFSINTGVVAYFGNASNFYISTPTSNGVYAPVSVATRQNINQYIITVTGNTVKFYLNGVSQALTNNTGGSPGFTASPGAATNGLLIGGRHPNDNNFQSPYDCAGGTYYLVRVYNTLLSQTDVTTNYNAIKTTYGI
jgi:hypothetical protein